MRVGGRVGPFYASTSTAGCGPWVLSFIVLLVIFGLIVDHPIAAAVTGIVVANLIGITVRRSRARHRSEIERINQETRQRLDERQAEDEKWEQVTALLDKFNRGEIPEGMVAAEYRRLTGRDFYGDTGR